MSELISNPQSQPEPQWTDGSGRVAHDGPGGLQHPGIVIRYDAVTDRSDQPDDPDAGDGEDPGPDAESDPGTGAAGRARAILGALVQGFLAASWACLRMAYRYPRWALVIVLSVVILGATALTRPGKPTPKAEIPAKGAGALASGPDRGKGPEKDGEHPKEDQPVLADAGSPTATKAEDGHKGAKENGTAAPRPADAPTAAPSAPKVADAAAAHPTAAERASTTNPPSASREPVPAPRPPDDQAGAANLAGASAGQGQAPAPAPPTPSTTAQAPASASPVPSSPGAQGPPVTPTAELARPNPELPSFPGPESSPPPILGSAATTTATTSRPAESSPPAPGPGVNQAGGAGAGTTPPPTLTPGGSAEGKTGTGQRTGAPPESGSSSQPPAIQPESPAPGSSPAPGPATPPPSGPESPSPLPPVTAPFEPLESPGAAPKSEPAAPAPVTKVEPGDTGATIAGESKDLAAPKAETVKPATPEDKPAIHGEAMTPGPPQPVPAPASKGSGPDLMAPPSEPLVKPEGPALGLDVSREEIRGGKAPAGETNRPNILREEDLRPGREERVTRAQGTISQPGIIGLKGGDNPPPRKNEGSTVPAQPDERPAPPPASEGTASRAQGGSSREEAAAERPAVSPSEPSGSAAQPTPDPAEGGWVRIPNKGRIPSGDEAARSESDPAPGRRVQGDEGVGLESGSAVTRSGDAEARTAGRPAGRGPAAPGVHPTGGSRAGARPSRVESSLHIVDRGENFWTISRLYYGDGRYYRALWKANSEKYPDIKRIHINDVILVPAVEDLDPAYIERSRRRPVAGRDGGSTHDEDAGPEGSEPSSPGPLGSFPTTRTARRSDTTPGDPGRPSGRVDAALELPVGDGERGPARDGRGRPADRTAEEESGGPGGRLAARPRSPASVDRPVYKVRRYDTLRSIARDVLGDPRRADELYELNRDIISDPTRLATGQLLELPEDADTRRLTARDRYRGRD